MAARPLRRRLVTLLAVAALFPVTAPSAEPRHRPPIEHAGLDQGAPTYYDSGVARTPYMGWNTYFAVGAASEEKVKSVADFLVSSGLAAAGYKYVWIDGGWNAAQPRDADGRLVADPVRFPSGMPALTDHLHRKGLRAGIYTDAGAWDGKNCAAGSGGGYYEADARQFAEWKFDAIKIDFLCGIAQDLDPAVAFTQFSAAVRKAGRPMILNLCNPVTDEWSVPHDPHQVAGIAYTYGPTQGDSWRTSTDVAFGTPYEGIWRDVLRNMDRNAAHPGAQGPGHYNDPDYLIPMRRTEQGTYELNEEESTTQFVMWSVMGSPLIIGSDPRTLPQSMVDTLKNPEIIGVDQDPRAIQGVRVATDGTSEVYSKVLSRDGERAVVLLNRGEAPADLTVNFADAGLDGTVAVRDLRARADRGSHTGSYTATVPAHGTAMLKLRGETLVPGTDLGGETTASPALVRFDEENAAVFSRGERGQLVHRSLVDGRWDRRWSVLRSPARGGILGQPTAFASDGGRIDLFVRGTDNAAYQRVFRDGRWGSWQRLGGTLTDSVSVAFTGPDDWTIFGRGGDGKVWAHDRGGDWFSLGAPNNTPTYGRPGAATVSTGTYVTVRLPDDSVWYRAKNPATGSWSAWTSLGGVISGSPTMVASADRIYLFVRGSDYTLWQQNLVDGSWGGWFKRDQFASNSLVGAVGAAAGADGSVWLAVRGPDSGVYQSVL